MGVRVLYDSEQDMAALYCSVTDQAFGPVVYGEAKSDWSAAELLEAFLKWLPLDARRYGADELERFFGTFREAKPCECRNYGCKTPATKWNFECTPNDAHADGFCSANCASAAAEKAYDRWLEGYYGASTPQTEGERYAAAAEQKRRLG